MMLCVGIIILLIAWNIAAPLKWERDIVFRDIRGNPTYSSGSCASQTTACTSFLVVILLTYLASLSLTALLSYKVRDVPTDYQESKYVVLILLSLVQIYVVAIPSTVAVYSVVIARFLLMSTIVFLTVVAILGLMFIPKVFKLGRLNEDSSHHHRSPESPRVPSKSRLPSSKETSFRPGIISGSNYVNDRPNTSSLVAHSSPLQANVSGKYHFNSSFVDVDIEVNKEESGGDETGPTDDAKNKSRSEVTLS